MSSNGNGNGNGNKKDKDRTIGQTTGKAIDTSVSWLDNMWDRHATKVVLVVLLLVLVFWYRKEVTEGVSSAAAAVGTAAASVGTAVGLSSDAPAAANGAQVMSAQVAPGELVGGPAPVPTASEIRALFNF
jgi:hypothetical protein